MPLKVKVGGTSVLYQGGISYKPSTWHISPSHKAPDTDLECRAYEYDNVSGSHFLKNFLQGQNAIFP